MRSKLRAIGILKRTPTLLLCLGLAGFLVAALPRQNAAKQKPQPVVSKKPTRTISFNRDVRPILSEHCYKCHGPAAREAKGDLRLNVEASAKSNKKGYAAIQAGQPNKSILLGRIHEGAGEMRMPPPTSGGRGLTPSEQDILRRWIAEGAHYEPHWAYQTPTRPSVPKVKQTGWVKNPIDAFVLSRLEKGSIQPEPEADRPTLVRRVSLTLTGLQPTPEEIQAFLQDDKPGAYERMVDRFLASKTYGEHQARYWLDAVRYGDTHGLHLDNERSIFPYRDFVVRAFNDDLPFDQFALWQLAGDMLPDPTLDQKIATGYIRMNPTTNEGGAIEDEFLAKNTFDRVETFSTIFLGATMTCARCHDHKYDPLSAKDYYSLYAFFNSTTDKPLDGNELAPAPVVPVPGPQQAVRLKDIESNLLAVEGQIDPAQSKKWAMAANLEPILIGEWHVSPAYSAENFDKAFDTSFDAEDPAKQGLIKWQPTKIVDGAPRDLVVNAESAAAYLKTTLTVSNGREINFTVSSDDGIRVWVNGTLVHSNKVLRGVSMGNDPVKAQLRAGANTLLVKVVNSGGPDGFRITMGGDAERTIFDLSKRLKAGESVTPKELRTTYLRFGPSGELGERYRSLLSEREAINRTLPVSLVAEELPSPRPARILDRGEYDRPGTAVNRAIPPAIGHWPKNAPLNRLGLAQWITQPTHPLTARVLVNRVWQQHFGTGLVKTVEDFGSQGDWPSHPELLDYVATEFVANGWSIKKLHRSIVTSATFRQRSNVSTYKLRRDPENRLFTRGPRFRVDAEVIRDQALYASGLLTYAEGGKGFKPYQPPGLWEAIGFLDSTTSRYSQDKGDTIYRRSLYLFWKRTSPPPAMLTFDAPMRESCTVRRSRTNTPLQALVLMNETAFVEASRFFAERIVMASNDDNARLEFAFQWSVGRLPKEAERRVLLASLDRYRERFKNDIVAADELLKIGDKPRNLSVSTIEHAAWTLIANTLFNTDEFVTQH